MFFALTSAVHYNVFGYRPLDWGWNNRVFQNHCLTLPIFIAHFLNIVIVCQIQGFTLNQKSEGNEGIPEVLSVSLPYSNHILWPSCFFIRFNWIKSVRCSSKIFSLVKYGFFIGSDLTPSFVFTSSDLNLTLDWRAGLSRRKRWHSLS